jgi:protein-arginine kinase activator protein McsA
MLCEQCKTAEATVHITELVAGAPAEEMKKRDFCEGCFSQTDLAKKVSGKTAGWTSSGPGFTASMWQGNRPGRK